MSTVYETIISRRTIRKYQQKPIPRETLVKFVNAARLAPSAANMQPLKYFIIDEPEQVKGMMEFVKWAAYLGEEGAPKKGEEPVAFIGIVLDTEVKKAGYELDLGASAQNIFLAALEEGIGTCWMGAINKEGITQYLSLPERYLLNSVIALGYIAEKSQVEDMTDSVKYYRDSEGNLHVPKRKLEDVLL